MTEGTELLQTTHSKTLLIIELEIGGMNNIITISISIGQNVLSISVSYILVAFIIMVIIGALFIKYRIGKNGSVFRSIIPISMKYGFVGQEISYNIVTNYANVEIAHRVYTEIMTRKAGQPFDEDNDVILEIYNSWYELFSLVRNEIKEIPGNLLHKNKRTKDFITLLMDILNKGIRPHLTIHQAQFRKWIDENSKEGIRPQELQKEYSGYLEQVESIKEVNKTLLSYSEELLKIVYGIKNRRK